MTLAAFATNQIQIEKLILNLTNYDNVHFILQLLAIPWKNTKKRRQNKVEFLNAVLFVELRQVERGLRWDSGKRGERKETLKSRWNAHCALFCYKTLSPAINLH